MAKRFATRPASTYRGARRNSAFGRKPRGNTKPHERTLLGTHPFVTYGGTTKERPRAPR